MIALIVSLVLVALIAIVMGVLVWYYFVKKKRDVSRRTQRRIENNK